MGTSGPDKLFGADGEDNIRGLGGKDALYGGNGNDVIHAGPGDDDDTHAGFSEYGDDVYYGGDGDDWMGGGGFGEDVIYGGNGSDHILSFYDHQKDKLYCGKGKDYYAADSTQETPTQPQRDMATWRIYMPCSRLDTWGAIASRGGGLATFIPPAPLREGSRARMMKRILMLLTMMALGVLMVSSAALALNRIQCPNGTDATFPVTCTGTPKADSMNGTAAYDNMKGKGGSDQLYGHGNNDELNGDYGHDTLNGGRGNDSLGDRYGTNTLNGGAGSDTFYADYGSRIPYTEISKISGGYGNDYVYAADGAKDTINCGAGNEDWVDFDPGLDVVSNCEIDSNGKPL